MAAGIYGCALIIAGSIVAAAQVMGPAPPPPAPRVTLASAQERQPLTFAPVRLGQRVAVEGAVSTKAINFGEYAHLPIQDDTGTALFIERSREALDEFSPGEYVRVVGTVTHRAGLPVIAPETIDLVDKRNPPSPQRLRVAEVSEFRNQGKYISVESFVISVGQNSGGDVIAIGGTGGSGAASPSILVFYPRFKRWGGPGLRTYSAGDKVRVVGLASQYCPVEPYDRGFQILVDDPGQVLLLERGWIIPPGFVLYLLVTLLVASGIWWMREHRMAEQRRSIRSMMALSEEVLSANSVGEISKKVHSVLPSLLNAWNVDVFLHNRIRNSLDRVPNDLSPDPMSVALEQPEGIGSAVALCFRNRALLNVPDFRRSPLMAGTHDQDLPAAAMFVPMFAKGEVLGVVAVRFRTRLRANRDQQNALQHVANQMAASIKLQEQQSIREQLLRTEKMAAAGQLISGVAHDLRAPLYAIREAVDRLARAHPDSMEEVEIASEADRGLQIVSHLLSFARMERSEARCVNVHQLASGVIESREPEWRRKSIQVENALPVSPVEVFADESELEQVVLSLLIHVEHAVEENSNKLVRVSSRVLGSRVQIVIDFSSPAMLSATVEEPTSGDSFGLRVCQAIAQSHGGDIRLFETQQGGFRYELELPIYHPPLPAESKPEPSRHASRVLTAIIIEPDAAVQRRLLAMMSFRGHRAIPMENAEDAADMVQRMSFDVLFCTIRLPGLSWIEFFKRVRRRVPAFVLLAESYDSDAGSVLKDGAGFVLRKPLEEAELDNVLADVEARHSRQ